MEPQQISRVKAPTGLAVIIKQYWAIYAESNWAATRFPWPQEEEYTLLKGHSL